MSASEPGDEGPAGSQPGAQETQSPEPTPSLFNRLLTWFLCLTLLVDGLAAISLALLDFQLTNGLLGPVFAVILLGLGAANLVALYSLLTKVSSWQLQCAVAQVLIAFLAGYIVLTAVLSPKPLPWWGWLVTVTAAALGIVAIGWVLRLVQSAGFQWSKMATVIVALLPLGGLLNFWYQSDYLPKMTDPLIDLSTDLSPIGRTLNTIRLSAKVTIHNRSQAKLYEPAGLLRVTAYPNRRRLNPLPSPDYVQQEIDFGQNTDKVFRASPTLPGEGKPLYVEDLAGPVHIVGPGQTVISQREVDLDTNQFGFVRLAATFIFFTNRLIRNDPQPLYIDGRPTIDYYIAPTSAIKEIVAGDWFLRIQLDATPSNDSEYPRILSGLCTQEALREHRPCPPAEEITRNNPVMLVYDWAEYAPTDHETNQK